MLGIRVASSFASGRGHIVRCKAIRAHIDEPVIWFPDEDGGHELAGRNDTVQIEREVESVNALQVQVNAGRVSKVLFDSYQVDPDAVAALSRSVPCLAICDFRPFPDVHRIVVPQAYQKSSGTIYGGLAYQIVAASFTPFRGRAVSEARGTIRILVSFGARDSSNRTGLVLSALELLRECKNSSQAFSVTCVLGENAPHREEIRERISTHTDMALMVGVDDLGPLYASHDLAIGAPGVSQAERAYCGLPTLLVAQNEAQTALCRAWADLNAALVAKPDLSEIAGRIDTLINSPGFRNDLRLSAMKLVDGAGAKRIADLIQEMTK